MQLCHSRPVVSSCPNRHKTAFKFQRIRCTTCFTSPDTKETTPAGKRHACCLHLLMPCIVSKAEAAGTEKEVSDCSEWLHMKECNSRGSQGTAEAAGHLKMADEPQGRLLTLLKRITKLKCVNSEVRTVNIHPEKGCLQWLHGTMSEPPWKSH